jgi:hypothetical protein
VDLVKACIQIHQSFRISVLLHIAHVILHFSNGMNHIVADGVNSIRQGRVRWCPYVLNPSSLGTLSTCDSALSTYASSEPQATSGSQNAIMQRLAEIGEWQAGRSQRHQQPQDSSYLSFLPTHPPVFAEMTDPLEANHWL